MGRQRQSEDAEELRVGRGVVAGVVGVQQPRPPRVLPAAEALRKALREALREARELRHEEEQELSHLSQQAPLRRPQTV